MADSNALSRRSILKAGGAMAALGAASVVLTACTSEKKETVAKTGSSQSGKSVVFVVHDKNPFFAPVQKGFEDFAAVMGWKAQFTGPAQQDIQAAVDMQATALNGKPAGVIFTRPDESAFDANIKRATSEGIPVVLSNVASADYQKLNVGFVGQEFIAAGKVCGHQIAKYATERSGQKGGVIIVGNFAPGNSALEQRAQGIKLGIDEYNSENGTTFTAEDLVTSTDEAKAVAAIDARWTREPVVGWAMTAFDHQFVSTWAESKGLSGKFGNGGFDLVAPVLDGIEAGTIDFSLGQNPYAQGWMAAAMLAQEIGPKFPGGFFDTGAEVVDKSNIAEVKKREAAFA